MMDDLGIDISCSPPRLSNGTILRFHLGVVMMGKKVSTSTTLDKSQKQLTKSKAFLMLNTRERIYVES